MGQKRIQDQAVDKGAEESDSGGDGLEDAVREDRLCQISFIKGESNEEDQTDDEGKDCSSGAPRVHDTCPTQGHNKKSAAEDEQAIRNPVNIAKLRFEIILHGFQTHEESS